MTYTVNFLDNVLQYECHMQPVVVLEAVSSDVGEKYLHCGTIKFELLYLLSCCKTQRPIMSNFVKMSQ